VLIGLNVWLVAAEDEHVPAETCFLHIVIMKKYVFSSAFANHKTVVLAVVKEFKLTKYCCL
jgi:hypothetical protein